MSEHWERLFVKLDPKSPMAEAFRVLRTNIQFAAVDRPLRAITITSPGPGEGKSTTLANLGVALAQSGARTILVDGDMRRPTLHKFFRLGRGQGLSTVLAGRAEAEGALQETGIEGLRLLTAGPSPPNPAEMLGSSALAGLLDRLKAAADYVLIDAPPVVAVSDASLLAAKADGVLLAVRLGATARPMAVQAKEQLEAAKVNLLGMILTNVGAGADQHLYHYYYHRYEEDD